MKTIEKLANVQMYDKTGKNFHRNIIQTGKFRENEIVAGFDENFHFLEICVGHSCFFKVCEKS